MIVKMILLWISTFNYFQLQFKKLLQSSQLSTQSPGLPNSWLTDARRHRWSRSWNLRSSVMTVDSKKKKKWGHQIMSDQKRPIQSFPNSRGHSGSKHQLAAKTLTDRRHDELPSYSIYTAHKPNHDEKLFVSLASTMFRTQDTNKFLPIGGVVSPSSEPSPTGNRRPMAWYYRSSWRTLG